MGWTPRIAGRVQRPPAFTVYIDSETHPIHTTSSQAKWHIPDTVAVWSLVTIIATLRWASCGPGTCARTTGRPAQGCDYCNYVKPSPNRPHDAWDPWGYGKSHYFTFHLTAEQHLAPGDPCVSFMMRPVRAKQLQTLLHLSVLTNWGQYKMAAILQTKLSNAFSWIKMWDEITYLFSNFDVPPLKFGNG